MKTMILRLDNEIHKQMADDKQARGFSNWESYIIWLFGLSKDVEVKK